VDVIKIAIEQTQPLKFPRGERLPLYLWPLTDVLPEDDEEAIRLLKALDERGLAVISSWNYGAKEASLAAGLRAARLQQQLGLLVNVNASSCLYSFCNGDEATAHVDARGEKFFDYTFSNSVPLGCPFALQFRYPAIKEQVEFFVRAYAAAGLPLHFIFTDWEIDGPIEWNGAWQSSKRCLRCQQNLPDLENFSAFQAALRTIRAEMQREVYADTVKAYFPQALVGNYAVNPHDGYRYWYDYFEEFVEGAPYLADQRAKYRAWFDEFSLSGFTFAMPVVYTWYPIFDWYDFQNSDYRWFYALLLEASSVGKSTPPDVPIITFVHYTTTAAPPHPDPRVRQMSEWAYRELLWHMLLRGHDAFFLWCPTEEFEQELRPLHQVYAESLEYRDFLAQGEPVCFQVPKQPGPVVSALKLGDQLLVRRTDFDDTQTPVPLSVHGETLQVERAQGRCQILPLRTP